MRIAVVIPTLNEERALPHTLRNVAKVMPGATVIIADGGSTDGTRAIVEQCGLTRLFMIDATRGRGSQMNAGAALASDDILLFLHADTQLPAAAVKSILDAMEDHNAVGGFFRIAFSPATPFTSLYAWLYNTRSISSLCYGDAAIFVRREIFDELGGYKNELLMEDLDLVLRLRKRGRLMYIRECAVTTSSRQFPTTWSSIKMAGIWLVLPILYAMGVSQRQLARLYPTAR